MKRMTFYEWLTSQNTRLDAVGTLARDVRRDAAWPKDKPESNPNQSYRRCRLYLALMVGESGPAMEALEQAVMEHRKERGNQSYNPKAAEKP